MLKLKLFAALGLAMAVASAAVSAPAANVLPLDHDRLVPGFLREVFGASGMATGAGWGPGVENPWGAYTAYLIAQNARGQRTWRVEDYLPGGATAQGSTMYLLEGDQKALLIDTAQNTPEVEGTNDLVTVVKFLLGHENDARTVRANPLDFVVANTHSHGDHIGENARMSDRTVYYPDGDWPRANAPANYVPAKEGGGPARDGRPAAVGQLELGNRLIEFIDIPEHTPGSMAYLDRANRMVATGDGIGSGYVWAHFGAISQYLQSVQHLRQVLEPYPDIAILPAHFYQVRGGARGRPPVNGHLLDRDYVDNQIKAAQGILDGSVVGAPYASVGREALIANVSTAGTVYTLSMLYRPGETPLDVWRPAKLNDGAAPDPAATRPSPVRSEVYLLRGKDVSAYLVKGADRALLVRTAGAVATPGLDAAAARLAGSMPVTSAVVAGAGAARDGQEIDLGLDKGGRPLKFEAYDLSGRITLLDVNDRLLFSGDALGTQGAAEGLVLEGALPAYAAALSAWRGRTDGKYDVVLTAGNYQWTTPPVFVDRLSDAVKAGLAGEGLSDAPGRAGFKLSRAPAPAPAGGRAGATDSAASIVFKP
ncbi:MAG: hypothetical protein JWM33_3857 [Caulobacteraceae bacterium]|nr:hypothetical protein [Caulobacteraceae bacterium]